MSIDRLELGPNIRNYIELNNSLELVGIGRLIKTNKGSHLSTNTNFIFPGATVLELENCEVGNDNTFVKYLSYFQDLTYEHALKLYKKFCAEINFDLETKGKALFYGLGQFIKKGKIATFHMNDSALKVRTFGLPALSLTPISVPVPIANKEIHKKVLKPIKSAARKDKRDRNFLINTAAIAAIFMLLIFAYHHYGSADPINQLSQLKVDQDRLNKDPEKLLISEKFIPALIPGIVEKEEKITSCALIIGSFSKQSNALEIQQKVLAAGYELFTEEYHNLYRVGVSLPCNEIQGAAFRKIEAEFGFDPWLRIRD